MRLGHRSGHEAEQGGFSPLFAIMCPGDYWPGEAENLLTNLSELSRQSGKKNSKPGRAAKGTKGKRYGSEPATTDSQLMDKLGDALQGMKADFIVVHLQEPCSFCRQYISDGTRSAPAPAPSSLHPDQALTGRYISTPSSPSSPHFISEQLLTLAAARLLYDVLISQGYCVIN